MDGLTVGTAVFDALGRPSDGAQQFSVDLDPAVRYGDTFAYACVELSLAILDSFDKIGSVADIGDGFDQQSQVFEGLVLFKLRSSTNRPSCRASSKLLIRRFLHIFYGTKFSRGWVSTA